MKENSNNPQKRVLIMACSGAANVGQLSDQVTRELVQERFARPFCLAGIGAHRKGFVKAAAEADTIIIDGCAIGCGKTILEHADIPVTKYLVLTDLGFEKNMSSDFSRDEINRVKDAIRESWKTDAPTFLPNGGHGNGSCSCCS